MMNDIIEFLKTIIRIYETPNGDYVLETKVDCLALTKEQYDKLCFLNIK